jgi:hypothetical protein
MCILVHFCLKNKNKEKNDKQPSQSLINDSPLKRFYLLKADKPNVICKQNYMWKRAPKVKCFLHSNCLYTHIDATFPIFGDIITEYLHMQINFTNLTFLHLSFKLQAWASTKQAPSNNIQLDYWTKQQSMNLSLSIMRNLPTNCLLENIHRKFNFRVKHHVKMSTHPLVRTMK